MSDDQIPAERQNVAMSADADVRWRNPDALTCDQTIRTHAINLALNIAGRTAFDRVQLQPALENAQVIAAYIANGTIPTTTEETAAHG
jgi:hypothetical protein